ncbi:MAG TPA: serine/threonine-protein kinase [Gemmataceae bacterium]|nr:serine/threonine-protein kinase [Gemmataceae bacterium]
MTPEAYERLWVVFDEVSRCDPAARGRILDERCAGDAVLRGEVEKLLEQDARRATDPLDAPGPLNVKMHAQLRTQTFAGNPAAGPALADPIGQRVGPYEIEDRIGEGGMGCVYRAVRRQDYEQRVAVKWIKPGLDADDVLQRFHRERQVLAALRHPNIAALLDGGALDGRPYFVMEYIEGTPIDRYCTSRRLGLAERVRLFLAVCSAVQYAHQNLVLHRDLKPANILVDAAGAPKLLDFGVAKLLTPNEDDHADARTQTGRLFATPEYASPEQLKGELLATTASDVYSLGVILYELLTGRRPHDAAGRSGYAVLRAVCEEEPASPRRWRKDVPYDLEIICLKCLQKDAGRRFPGVAPLADELEQFLAGRPIRSRPVGALERAFKWVRRRPAAAALLAVSIAAVLGLFAIGFAYNRRLENAVAAETAAKNRMRLEKDRADANLLATLGVLQKELVGVKQGDQRQWLGQERRKQLQELLDRFEALQQINADDPSLAALLTQAYAQMAAVQELLGDYVAAERSLTQALALHRRLRQESPDDPAHRQTLAAVLHDLGRVRANARLPREAEEAYREAIDLHRQSVAASPEPSQRDALARDLHDLANLLARDPARRSEARAAYEEAARLHEQLAAEQPDSAYQYALSQDRYQMQVLDEAGLDEKEKACRRQIDDLEALAADRAPAPAQAHELAMLYHQLGKLLAQKAREGLAAARTGRPVEVDALAADAEDAFARAIELDEPLARDNADVPRYRFGLAQHYMDMGDLFLWTARHPDKARAPYQAAVELLEAPSAKDAAHEHEGDLGCACEKLGQAWLRPPDPNPQAAADALSKAVEHLGAALKRTPGNASYSRILADAVQTLNQLQTDRKP